jgi:hypothetical protein
MSTPSVPVPQQPIDYAALAQQVSQGGATPPPAPVSNISFGASFNPDTKQWEGEPQQVNAPKPVDYAALAQQVRNSAPAIDRFAKSFNQTTVGASDFGQLWDNLKTEAGQIAADPTGEANPEKLLKSISQGMQALWNRAVDEAKQGNLTSAKGLSNYLAAGVHGVESGVPVPGTIMGQAGDQFSNGDIAGGLGTMTAGVLPIAMGGVGEAFKQPPSVEAGGFGTGTVTNPPVAPSRLATAAQSVGQVAKQQIPGVVGGGVGAALGHATGIPGMGEIGGIAGYTAGRKLFPNAAEVAQDAAKPKFAPTPEPMRPANAEPVPAAQYIAARRSGLSDEAATAQSYQAYQDAKSARAAVNKAVDATIPPTGKTQAANMNTKAEVDFYLQKGDAASALKALWKNAAKAGVAQPAEELMSPWGGNFSGRLRKSQ